MGAEPDLNPEDSPRAGGRPVRRWTLADRERERDQRKTKTRSKSASCCSICPENATNGKTMDGGAAGWLLEMAVEKRRKEEKKGKGREKEGGVPWVVRVRAVCTRTSRVRSRYAHEPIVGRLYCHARRVCLATGRSNSVWCFVAAQSRPSWCLVFVHF